MQYLFTVINQGIVVLTIHPHLGVLSFVLARSRTGFRRTDTIINRLIRGAIQTGLFASIFALADLFSFVLHRNTNLYAMFAYPIGRIYTNV